MQGRGHGAQSEFLFPFPQRYAPSSFSVWLFSSLLYHPPQRSLFPSSLPQLEDFIPEVEEFYRKKHNGRKLYWHHIMSNGVVRSPLQCLVSYGQSAITLELQILLQFHL